MPGTASYLVRRAVENDAARIAVVHVKTWRAAYRGLIPDDYLAGLDTQRRERVWKDLIGAPEEMVQVAMRGSRIVGFCSLLPSRDSAAPPEIAEISSLYVEPSEWGRGAGRSLMDAALDHAASHGFMAVTLWVLSANERAKRFYAKAGFSPDGTEQDDERLGFPIHEVRYRRDL
jgi:ribosomal protein S18 acetylase RimI-like enzyme